MHKRMPPLPLEGTLVSVNSGRGVKHICRESQGPATRPPHKASTLEGLFPQQKNRLGGEIPPLAQKITRKFVFLSLSSR